MFPIIPFTNSTTGNPGNNNIMNYLPVLLIAFVLFRMIRRGMTGSVYSRSRILRRPAIYIVLTVILNGTEITWWCRFIFFLETHNTLFSKIKILFQNLKTSNGYIL